MTLSELQEIGSEVGIPISRISEAAQAIDRRDVAGRERKFLGAPMSVSRTVLIDRDLSDVEWTRLVVDLRETFQAVGKVSASGQLRSWTNGNLQVHVEPDGDRYRVRMRTFKGNIPPLTVLSGAFILMAVVFLMMALLGEAEWSLLIFAGFFGLPGLGQIAYARSALPNWANERGKQMERLAERIPRLLHDSDAAGL